MLCFKFVFRFMDIWDDLQFVIAIFSVVLIREWCIKVCFSIVLVFSVYSSDSHFYINFFVNKIKVKQNKTKIYLETSIENKRERDTFEIYSVPPFLLFSLFIQSDVQVNAFRNMLTSIPLYILNLQNFLIKTDILSLHNSLKL